MQAHTEAQAVHASAGRNRKERSLFGPAWSVARKEVADLYGDGRVLWAMAAVTLLIMVSVALSWQDFRAREATRTEADRAVRHQWENQGAKNPHSAAHFGQYAFTLESVPAAIDPGTLAHTGSAVWLEPHRRNLFGFRPAEDQTAAVRYGPLTPALLLQVVVPLLIVSFCFASVAGEREAGTLRLVLSLGLTRGQLFLGKALGVALASGGLVLRPDYLRWAAGHHAEVYTVPVASGLAANLTRAGDSEISRPARIRRSAGIRRLRWRVRQPGGRRQRSDHLE